MSGGEILRERYDLVMDRIRKIPTERFGDEKLEAFFSFCAEFLLMIDDTAEFLAGEGLKKARIEELADRNRALYADILPEHYGESYGNPGYAVRELGEELGAVFSSLYAELRSLIGFVYEGRLEELVIRMELFAEIYTAFVYAADKGEERPSAKDVRDMIYWFACDYADLAAERRTGEQMEADGFAVRMIMESDLTDLRYLYGYGEYVGENELETAGFLAGLPEETIATMADTYTEGYRMGFEVTGVDLSRKRIVSLGYQVGFERMLRRAVRNFERMGLKAVSHRAAWSVLDGRRASRRVKNGFSGGVANPQFEYDHKDDKGIFFDKNYANRQLEAMRAACEKWKRELRDYAGPAIVETFGEADFTPAVCEHAVRLSKEQERLGVEHASRAGMLSREYTPGDETSFTIIAFPVPEIGEVFEELFRETIRINTLDYMLYRRVQQTLIDALDTADTCEIRGRGANRTNLRVNLYKLADPGKETIFENCVADVNIPVGEVFTSPVLNGTEGVLHVTRAFLGGLEYKDLTITFEDGMVRDYSCGNFEDPARGRNFIYENILARHETLPMGEFAIGTNTTAYVAARRLGVEAKLPVLIAEKMGPHFAVGDTCYSHAEDRKVYNPDGKEIVARDNEVSLLRRSSPMDAYYNCHTDITVPYDELGELTAVRKDGSRVPVIKDGRFVLPGCEELNKAFGK
ncbi:MAG: aminopeptidase [Lachnospiraceae bacterium]|nr:aminopeptidase [Lachnospiraceae bacterium]